MNDVLTKLYDIAPYPIQSFLFGRYAAAIKRKRFSSAFRELSSDLLRRDFLTEEEIRAHQLVALRRILSHAGKRVPYYAELFAKLRFRPGKLNSIDELHQLPILRKDDVKRLGKDLYATGGFSRPITFGATSGTTGSPLSLLYDRETVLLTDCLDWKQKRWAGVEPESEHAYILGRTIVRPSRTRPPYWQFDRSMNNLWISAFHLSDDFLDPIVSALRRYQVRSIEGYPSSLSTLARLAKKRGITIPMSAAFTSSETLYGWQRSEIEETFQCKLYDFYGLAERVAFAIECPEGGSKHLCPEFAINEITDEMGNPTSSGTTGYLTGTTLSNYAMPLIRYQTSDLTSILSEPCGCGRGLRRIRNIETKAEDLIRTPEGKTISPSILTHPFKKTPGIRQSQIVQERLDEITVKIVSDADFCNEARDSLKAALSARIGKGVTINVVLVDRIELGPNAKYRWVISKVPNFLP